MIVDAKENPKADMAIRFRKDVASLISDLENYLPDYQSVVIDMLENDPRASTESIKAAVLKAHDDAYNVYDNQAFNEALIEVSKLGKDALQELKNAIDVLGETIDLELVKQGLSDKYPTAEAQRKDINLSDNLSATKDLDQLLDQESRASLQGLRPERDVETSNQKLSGITEQKPVTPDLKNIQKVKTSSGQIVYKFNGKSYFSLEAARKVAGLYQASRNLIVKEANNEKSNKDSLIKDAERKITIGVITGSIQVVGSILFLLYFINIAGSYSAYADGLGHWLEAAILIVIALTWGIHQKSRAAATASLVITLLPTVVTLLIEPSEAYRGLLWIVLFGWGYYQAVKGTYRYHSLFETRH